MSGRSVWQSASAEEDSSERSKTGEEHAEDRIGTDRASTENLLSKGDEDVALFGGGRME